MLATPLPTHQRGASEFRPDIEGLRGLAILLVAAFHCNLTAFKGGFVGVDIFFVLSGYLITGLLVKELDTTGRLSLVNFYARRARRLLPAATLVLLVTLLAAGLLLSPDEITSTAKSTAASALYFSNEYFVRAYRAYFSPLPQGNPVLHTWSLAVEEQFYLLWPILLPIIWKIWKSRRARLAVIAALTLASLALSVRYSPQIPFSAFYRLPFRAWEFGLGALATLLPWSTLVAKPRLRRILGWVGLATVIASLPAVVRFGPVPGWVAAIPCLGAAAMLIAGTDSRLPGTVSILLALPPLRFLGRVSYAWYLWHWPVLVVASAVFSGLDIPARLACVIVALALATLTHFAIEDPIRYTPRLIPRPALSLILAAALVLTVLGSAGLALRQAASLANQPTMRRLAAATHDISSLPRGTCNALSLNHAITCSFGNAASSTTVVLFGDSHAIQWFDALRVLANQANWNLVTFVKSDCPAADVGAPFRFGSGATIVGICQTWRREAIQKILALHPTLVVVAGKYEFPVDLNSPDAERTTGISVQAAAAEWQAGTRRTLRQFTDAGLKIALLRDVPRAPTAVADCLERASRYSFYPSGHCDFIAESDQNSAFAAAEQRVATSLPGITWVDMNAEICPNQRCLAQPGGIVSYRDTHHLTGAFAATLAPALQQRLPLR